VFVLPLRAVWGRAELSPGVLSIKKEKNHAVFRGNKYSNQFGTNPNNRGCSKIIAQPAGRRSSGIATTMPVKSKRRPIVPVVTKNADGQHPLSAT